MELVPKNYLTPPVDWEYKYWKTLATLQNISGKLEENKIYPAINKLDYWEKTLEAFLKNAYNVVPNTPEIDYEPLKVIEEEHSSIEDFMELMRFALKNVKILKQKAEIKLKELMQLIYLEPVGIYSLNTSEGFLLINNYGKTEKYIYQLWNIRTTSRFPIFQVFWLGYKETISSDIQSEKQNTIKRFSYRWSNPAFFYVESKVSLPSYSAVIPVSLLKIREFL